MSRIRPSRAIEPYKARPDLVVRLDDHFVIRTRVETVHRPATNAAANVDITRVRHITLSAGIVDTRAEVSA